MVKTHARVSGKNFGMASKTIEIFVQSKTKNFGVGVGVEWGGGGGGGSLQTFTTTRNGFSYKSPAFLSDERSVSERELTLAVVRRTTSLAPDKMRFRLFVIVFLIFAGYAVANDDDDACCSAEDRHELQSIWRKVWTSAFTARRVAIAGAVFHDFLRHYPSAKSLFERVNINSPNSAEFHAHLLRVTNGFDSIIHLLDDTQVLREHLSHLASQHIARKGVTKEYFEGFGKSFSRVLPQVVSCFNVEAFDRCYSRFAKRVAKDLP